MKIRTKAKFGSAKKRAPTVVVDLITGESRQIGKVPFIIGNTAAADWPMDILGGTQSNEVHLSKNGKGPGFLITPHYYTQTPMLMDGALFESPIAIPPDRGLILKIHTKLFGFSLTGDPQNFVAQLNLGQWMVFDGISNQVLGNFPLDQISGAIASSGANFENCAVSLPNLGAPGIWLKDMPDIIAPLPPAPVQPQPVATPEPLPVKKAEAVAAAPDEEMIPSDVGEFQCPICWLHFEGKHMKHISSHQELLGDSKLGNAHQRRFVPKKWDASGVALDDFGIQCPDTACPHCHERLPAGFGEFKQYIYSIVGAPSSGKSYYLAILIKQLKRYLFHNFEISFMDQDPEYNNGLNDVINTLFTAKTASQGRIIKTAQLGPNYRKVKRNSEDVDLPKPSIFNISQTNVENTDSSLVFYDNAGEHFLPSNSGANDFQILHVAKASALFFIYDPLVNIDIRHALINVDSEQLEEEMVPDQQSTILSQMNVKISRALGKPTTQKLEQPLAVIVGKYDLWRHIIDEKDKIVDPLGKDGLLYHRGVDLNSSIARKFLNEYAPDIVATSERLSSNVRYFPVSAFGQMPKQHPLLDEMGNPIKDPSGNVIKETAPEPSSIKPILIEIPTIWALSQTVPDLIPDKLD